MPSNAFIGVRKELHVLRFRRARRTARTAEDPGGFHGREEHAFVGSVAFEHGAVVFFELQKGVKLALFERGNIAHDAGIATTPRSPTEFTIGHNVGSEKEVDAVMHQAIAAGARLVKPAQKTFWGGYAGYFQDPDDHLWEIIFNPAFLPED